MGTPSRPTWDGAGLIARWREKSSAPNRVETQCALVALRGAAKYPQALGLSLLRCHPWLPRLEQNQHARSQGTFKGYGVALGLLSLASPVSELEVRADSGA